MTSNPPARLPWPHQLQLLIDNGDGTCTALVWALQVPEAAVVQLFLGQPQASVLIPTASVREATDAYQSTFISTD